jgi:hypothetical protein
MTKSKPTLKYPDRKISDTFLQFAEPLLDAFGPNVTEAQMEQPLMIAWTVWNAVVYADAGENKQMLENVQASMGHDPQLKGFVEFLIDRKRIMFGDDHRLIGEYKLFRNDGEIRLRAEARDPRSRNL